MNYENTMLGVEQQPAPQGSGVWFQNRLGKLTASKMIRALDKKKDGSNGAKREQLLWEIVSERLTNIPSPHFVNDAMRWGTEYEPVAKQRYSEATDRKVTECGLFDHPQIDMLAASPDGLVDPGGLLEVKCPTTTTHLQWLLQPACPLDYQPQMLIQLACTGRRWVDFVSFDPRLPVLQQMKVWRFEPSQAHISAMVDEAVEFLARASELMERVCDSTAIAV